MRCPVCSFENPDDVSSCQRCLSPLAAQRTERTDPLPQAIGAPPQRARRLGPGVIVDNKYSIERVIGEGGMGIVYLAHDVHTEQKVVVKALHDSLAEDPVNRERVRSEGKALARIDHPNVVRLNAVVDDGATLLLIMQFVDGKSLDKLIEERIAERKPMPVSEVASLFRQMVLGVAAAHHEGLVHRDLKPANVLLRTKDGVAKVTDFGIAKTEDDAKAGRGKTQGIIGSLWYMSPEQVTGERNLDKRVDIYALGIVLFELCCGKVPFDADSDYAIMRMHVDQEVPTITVRRPDLPAALDGVIRRAAAKRREDRFQSCEELLVAFDAAVSHGAHAAFPQPSDPSLPPTAPQGPGGTAPLVRPASVVVPAHASVVPPSRGAATTGSAMVHDGRASTEGTPPVYESSVPGHTFEGEAPTNRKLWLLVPLLLVVAVGTGVALKVLMERDRQEKWRQAHRGIVSSATVAVTTTAPSASPSASAKPAGTDPLDALVGKWVSDGARHYDAVRAGAAVEFRVRIASEHGKQNYLEGETRFSVRYDGKTYLVEDAIRSNPPSNAPGGYAPESRATCVEPWTKIGDEPLTARLEGQKLTVEMVKFNGEPRFFDVSDGKVTSCRDFKTAKVSQATSILTREGP